MNGDSTRRLLWIDDDGERRFSFEQIVLEEKGWEITWVESVQQAAEVLVKGYFELLFLDQMLPLMDGEPEDVWGGSILLHWLRGTDQPEEMPPHDVRPLFGRRRPRKENRSIPVVRISAFQDDEVDAAMHEVDPSLLSVSKPIDMNGLMQEIDRLVPAAQGRP